MNDNRAVLPAPTDADLARSARDASAAYRLRPALAFQGIDHSFARLSQGRKALTTRAAIHVVVK